MLIKTWDYDEQQFSACYLIFFPLVVQGNMQGIPSPKEKERKEKEHSSKVVKSLVGTWKICLAMECERKGWESAKVLNKN
jgi:hypothetical protein